MITFFLEFKVDGEDAYPRIREAAQKPETKQSGGCARGDAARARIFCHRIEREHRIQRMVPQAGGPDRTVCAGFLCKLRAHHYGADRRAGGEMEEILAQDSVDLKRGQEYAAYILNAVLGDGELFEFNGNVLRSMALSPICRGMLLWKCRSLPRGPAFSRCRSARSRVSLPR